MNRNLKKLMVVVISSLPFTLMAHPGHGHSDPETMWHYLGEYSHALPIVGLVLLTVFLLWSNFADEKEKAD